ESALEGSSPVSTGYASTSKDREAQTSDLDRLIDLESKLQGFLSAARARAAARVEAARKRAETIEGRLTQELAARESDLAARIQREAREQSAATRTRARARAERFDGISEARIDELAAEIVRLLVRGEPG
ncbi:MAG TPA: hypothetical protein VKA53_10785, partial [Thermoanaerobaculia bacterium]|nr:hypothetical protein [Thermoanaerobaculia bacterium]